MHFIYSFIHFKTTTKMSIPVSLKKEFLCDPNILPLIKKFNTFQTLNSALSVATEHNHFSLVKIIVDKGADNLHENLYCACRNGQLDIFSLLVNKGVLPRSNCYDVACEYGHLEIVKYLCAQPDEYIPCDNMLQMACKSGNKKLVKWIISKKFSNDFSTGLYGAIIGGHQDIINMMIDLQPGHLKRHKHYVLYQVNNNDKNFFDWGLEGACQVGNHVLINRMLKRDGSALYGFIGACKGDRLDIAQKMLTRFKNISEPRFEHYLEHVCSFGSEKFINLFTSHFAFTNFVFSKEIMLECACRNRNMSAAKLMLRLGADIDQGNFNVACGNGDSEIVKLLLKEATKQNVVLSFQDAFESACDNHNSGVVEFLINQEVIDLDIALLNTHDESIEFVRVIINHMKRNNILHLDMLNQALHDACWCDDICVATLFIKSGASLRMSDMTECFYRNNMTVIYSLIPLLPKQSQLSLFRQACENKLVEIVEFFLEHNSDFVKPRFMSLRSFKKPKL